MVTWWFTYLLFWHGMLRCHGPVQGEDFMCMLSGDVCTSHSMEPLVEWLAGMLASRRASL